MCMYVSGTDLGGSKVPKEPPGLHRGFPEPPVKLVGKNFRNSFILSNDIAELLKMHWFINGDLSENLES